MGHLIIRLVFKNHFWVSGTTKTTCAKPKAVVLNRTRRLTCVSKPKSDGPQVELGDKRHGHPLTLEGAPAELEDMCV